MPSPYGVRSVSPWRTWTSSGGIPSSSATICANVVSWPWPWVCALIETIALPEGWTRRSAPSFIDMPRMSMCLRGPAPTPSVKKETPMPISSPRARFSACSLRSSS